VRVRIAVTGSTGLIGTALVTRLRGAGHDVVRLVRRPPHGDDEISWDPQDGFVDVDALRGIDAAVHLAGAGIADRRWTGRYKKTLLTSRLDGTRTLAEALASLDPRPRVLVSGSAVDYYGDRGDEVLTESSPPGSGFLSDLVQRWEAAATPAAEAGIRVAHARTGIVLSPDGGALARLLPLARLGLAGTLGDGHQWWPWITLADEVRALEFLVGNGLTGPVNLTAPQPVRNAEAMRTISASCHRPVLLSFPGFTLRMALGGVAESVLASRRVLPSRLLEEGFTFGQRTMEQASLWAVRRSG
jgi:uncharacterized protein (TIGR01777 family)